MQLSVPADPAAVLAGNPPTNSVSTNTAGPQIQFASTVYDFGKVVAGEVARCEFVFTNTGDALLEINGVAPGCGCTAAGEWTRQVEPGKTGTIPLQFNSSHYMGAVAKTATVASNARNQPTVVLQIKGTIWKPIEVIPPNVVMTIVPDSPSNAPAVVRIVSGLNEPISLSDPQSSNPEFAVEVRTNQPGKVFELLIHPVPPFGQGAAQGTISVKTSSSNTPVVSVSVFANIQPALVVMPPQIQLPPIIPGNAFPCAVSIRNNSPILLSLSEPAVNAKGATVQIKEVVPGRQFTATVTFPAGFKAVPGDNLELSLKTSNPGFPLVKVPIRQQPAQPLPRVMPPIKAPPAPTNLPPAPSGVRMMSP
jgi:hypothetical protein